MDAMLCPGCIARDQLIEQLRLTVARLEQRVAQLEQQLAQAQRDRKRQAAPFAKGPPKPKPKTPGRKAGPEHGPHAHRPPPSPDLITETHDAFLPVACPQCGGELREDAEVREQFQVDVPVQPVHRKFRIHQGTCQRCGKHVQGRHPLQTSDATGAAQSQTGPNLQAGITYLNKHAGLSAGKIVDFFAQASGILLRPSTATRIVLRTADKLEPVYQTIRDSLKNAEQITPDETGWRIGGRPAWLHAWVSERATCYAIDPHRSADALEKVIGIDYSGYLIHDGASTYDRFGEAIHQQCVAHVLRRAQRMQEVQIGRAQEFPRQVIDLLQSALRQRDAFVAGQLGPDDLDEAYVEHLSALWDLTERRRTHPANETLRKHLRDYDQNWFPFLLFAERPATNYQAEQALRLPIQNRKVFGGNRTQAGADAQAIVCSTLKTCEQQARSPLQFLKDALTAVKDQVRSLFSTVPHPQTAN